MFDVSPLCIKFKYDELTLWTDDGSMTADTREYNLQRIKSSKSTRLILISFKAGSTGKQCLLTVLLHHYVSSQASI